MYDNIERATTTEPEDIRINARLSGDDARRFRELMASQTMSASDLLRSALREYHLRHRAVEFDAADVLERNGFIAGGDGPDDLSANYKRYLGRSLEDKYPLRVREP